MSLYSTTWALQVEKLLPPVLRDKSFIEVNDDFKTGDSENQVIQFLIESSAGHWKEFPLVGVGIYNYLQNTATKDSIRRKIREQLQGDGFNNPLIDVSRFPIIVVNKLVVEVE